MAQVAGPNLAPFLRKQVTVLECPLAIARSSGLTPSISTCSKLAPFSSNSCTTSEWPLVEAKSRGAQPFLSAWLIFAPWSKRQLVAWTLPLRADQLSAERPSLSAVSKNEWINENPRVSVQGVKSLGGHFACLCRGFEFYEVKKNFLLLFFKKKMEILLHF